MYIYSPLSLVRSNLERGGALTELPVSKVAYGDDTPLSEEKGRYNI